MKTPTVTVSELPPSADDLLLDNQLLKRPIPENLRPKVLSRVREAAARYPGDRLATLALARAGLDVLLLDRARVPRDKPCGE